MCKQYLTFAFLGAYVAISLCEQLRLSAVHQNQPKLLGDNSLVVIMAIFLGGVGIWCMHFVGMSAMHLENSDSGIVIHLEFGVIRTVMSLVSVVLLLYIGLLIGAHDVVFRKTKTEIVEMFIDQSKSLTFKQIQGIKNGYGFLHIIGNLYATFLLAHYSQQ